MVAASQYDYQQTIDVIKRSRPTRWMWKSKCKASMVSYSD